MPFTSWSYDDADKSYVGRNASVAALPPGMYELDTDCERPSAKARELRADLIYHFASGVMNAVLAEVEAFRAGAAEYARLGITHKRGILLHGAPGCGKTTIALAIARHTVDNGGIVLVPDRDYLHSFAKAFPWLRQIEAQRPATVLLEDVDRLCTGREEDLLGLLDGATSFGGDLLFVATTNSLDDVPDRVKGRPSRIDTVIEVPQPDRELRREYLTRLLGDRSASLPVAEWAARTDGWSIADLKGLVVSVVVFGGDPDRVLSAVP